MDNEPLFSKRSPTGQPWAMLTAYDAIMAKAIEDGGGDLILVGDSLGRAVLGYDSENEVSLNDMIHHAKAVVRRRERCPIIVDLPFNTYNTPEEGLASAQKVFSIDCDAIKLEGVLPDIIRKIVSHNIPVVAHLGYTPQTGPTEGSKVIGKTLEQAEQLLLDARVVQDAGACMLVIEMVPREVSKIITESLNIPVIGIGSGPDCDGQVLVTTDMWGDHPVNFKFLNQFGQLLQNRTEACKAYSIAVKNQSFPSDSNSFHIKKSEKEAWMNLHQNESTHQS